MDDEAENAVPPPTSGPVTGTAGADRPGATDRGQGDEWLALGGVVGRGLTLWTPTATAGGSPAI